MDAWLGPAAAALGWAVAGALLWSRIRIGRAFARFRHAALGGPWPGALLRPDGRILVHNESFARLFEPEPAPSRLDREVLERLDVPPLTAEKARRTVASGRPWEGTLSLRRPLGDVVELSVRAVPLDDDVVLLQAEDRTAVERLHRQKSALVADAELAITARTAELLQRTEQLQRAKDAYQDLYDHAPHMYFTLDREGRIVGCNHAAGRALGCDRASLVGRSLADLATPDSRSAVEEALATLAAGRPVEALEIGLLGRRGGRLDAILDAVPAGDGPGEPGAEPRARVQAVDITALKAQQELLRRAFEALAEKNALLEVRNEQAMRAHRLKSEFIATVSHELRTPLHAVLGFGELLQHEVYGPLTPRQREAVDGIVARMGDLLRLFTDMLDLSRIEAGHLALEDERFSPAEVIEEVVATGRMLLREKAERVRLQAATEKAPETVRGDRGRYKQVLLNLVTNAIKHTDSGRVDVACRAEDDGTFTTAVTDTGRGIPTEEIPFIFDPFYQVDGSTTRTVGGAGLGLTIARRLAERMGGTLHASSRLAEGEQLLPETADRGVSPGGGAR